MNDYALRIESLRSLMNERGYDAVILTGSDPHGSEYPAGRWKQVQYLTGFTGEAGDVVVTSDHAGLWTDTRYFIQAIRQLEGTGVELHKTRVPEQVLIPEWLPRHFSSDSEIVLAVDALCVGADYVQGIVDSCEKAGVSVLVAAVPNLLDCLWKDRPSIPRTPVFTVDPGESRVEKIEWLRDFCARNGCAGILLSALDEIAWTLNVRASDIEYNPLVISYLLVTEERACWFVLKEGEEDGISASAFDEIGADGVEILPYSDLEIVLATEMEGRLFIDPSKLNYHIFKAVSVLPTEEGESPVALRKAVKNPVEIRGMKACQIRDGVAMEKFLYWLETSVREGRRVDEWEASVYLSGLRAENPEYVSDSFETISAYGPGAALPHYSTPRDGAPVIEPRGLYLCDSGGQYTDGTTDITRTIPMGECTPLEKEDYTLVLKCHIDLAMAVFPEGTPGCRLDILAREPLWSHKRNFGHGTGHGVGYFLGVHEGPHEFRQNFNSVPLAPGMDVTIEPGIYREGRHGVRHENMVFCVPAGENDFGRWMQFETITLCHFDTSAVVRELLTEDERKWLNAYNARVRETLSPLLPPEVALWLKSKTSPLD